MTLRPALRGRLGVLRNRQFTRLLSGRSVSFLGDGLFTVAAMWLVFDLTGSSAFTGLAGFLLRAPTALKVLAGPLVDRSGLGPVLWGSEALGVLLALVVPVAAATGHLSVWVVLAVLPLYSLTELFAAPAQTAALPRLVDRESLVRANSALSVATNVVTAGSRAIGGALVAAFGAVTLFVVDASTYLVATVLFLGLAVPAAGGDEDAGDDGDTAEAEPLDLGAYRRELVEGFDVLTGSVLGLMLLASLTANALASAAFAVLPAFADRLGGPTAYGFLLAVITGGIVVGSLLAPVFETRPLGRTSVGGFVVSGLLWTAGVELGGFFLTAALFGLSRVPLGVYNVGVQATMQTGVRDGLLGRVTATVSSLSNVVGPLGLLLGGVAGDVFGARAVLFVGGVGTLLTALLWGLVPSLRRFGPPNAVESGSFG